MKTITRITVTLFLISIFLTACAQSATPTVSFETVVANTMAVMQTQQAILSTITPYVVPPTDTPIPPTLTPSPTSAEPTATATKVTPTPSESFCISTYTNVNYPNNSSMKGGTAFTKTWNLTNGGSAAWGADFKLVLVSGDSMNATDVLLNHVVLPGNSIDVSVPLVSPVSEGDHRANFMLETDGGYKFGIGPNCDRPVSVLIRTSGVFQVTSAQVKPDVGSYIGPCPATINLAAVITANGVGTVTYVFRSNGWQSDTYQLDFSGSGTLTSSEIEYKVTKSVDLKIHLYVDQPNHQDFSSIVIPITCTP